MHEDTGTYEKGDIKITITPGGLNIAKDFKQNETKNTSIISNITNSVHTYIKQCS